MKKICLIIFFATIVFAQYEPPESTVIMFSISSCPLRFTIDSLPAHEHTGMVQDTYFLPYFYREPVLDWNTSYMVGAPRGEYPDDYFVPLWVQNIGCVPLDFELSTYSRLYYTGEPWWTPSDTSKPGIDKYVLRVLMTGIGSGMDRKPDTVRFSGPHSFYYVVHSTPNEIRKRRVLFGPDSAWCCYYDPDLGYNNHPTISASGVNLPATRPGVPDSMTAMFFHIMLTTPFGTMIPGAYSDSTYRTGIIVLTIKAKMHDSE